MVTWIPILFVIFMILAGFFFSPDWDEPGCIKRLVSLGQGVLYIIGMSIYGILIFLLITKIPMGTWILIFLFLFVAFFFLLGSYQPSLIKQLAFSGYAALFITGTLFVIILIIDLVANVLVAAITCHSSCSLLPRIPLP